MNNVISKWNDKYAPEDFVFGKEPNDFLTTQIERIKDGGDILAAGDGEGRNGVWLARQGFQVLSVDGAENGVRKAIKWAKECGVANSLNGLCVDLLDWDWPCEAFDAIVSLHLHFMPEERRTIHHKMLRALRPGGIFIQEIFHPDQVGRNCGGPKVRELCATPEELADDFKGTDILHLEKSAKTIKPSAFHNGGQGVVSRIVVRKP